ncbi:MAG TPA: phytanoyl-CoA dioxygenase family protein [Vitreimonas sp.]|uniref:phytanoyl-CoA dioxygenase family protein n=1 Tax=Vitreimonas sp. TaxID=3069702 RepID=UPI002D442D27|nr:phytanoyl-CoA dioxygenase family protein [Vitreimonas sp.]HYD86036.1 phytanoyl-CoA dioxygenase family protein [Vitreimonas sp.]
MFDSERAALPRVRRADGVEAAIAMLRRYGALIVEDAAESDLMEAVKSELSPWFERAFTGTGDFFGKQTKRFSGVFAKAPVTAHLAGDGFILEIVERVLIGPQEEPPRCDKIQLNLTQAIGILPGQGAQVLHRDEVMFPFAHDFEVMANVMWTLDPWTAENGATRIVPGSGSWPRTRLAQKGEVIAALAPANAAIIWLGSTIHGGGMNASGAIRRGLAFSYSLGWLAQAEKLLLSTPPDVARRLPEPVQRLIGYQLHKPNLGWIEEQDPIRWLNGEVRDLAPADDNLTEAQQALIRWRLAAQEAAA